MLVNVVKNDYRRSEKIVNYMLRLLVKGGSGREFSRLFIVRWGVEWKFDDFKEVGFFVCCCLIEKRYEISNGIRRYLFFF